MPTVDELNVIITANIAQMKTAAAQARAALASIGVSGQQAGAATAAGMAEAGAATNAMAAESTAAAATTTGALATIRAAATTLGATLKTVIPFLGLATGAAAFVGALKTGVEASAALESAQILLANSLKKSDDIAGDVAALTKRAQALEMVSRYGDDEILTVMKLLATYGMDRAEIEKTTQAVMDLAVAKGIDLRSATDLLGKAYAGQLGTLSRYGIIVKKTGDKEKDFANVLKLINDQMGGAAQADVQTFSGAMARLGNVFSDMLRGVGDRLAPVLMALAQGLTWLFNTINTGHPLLDKLGNTLNKIGAVLNVLLAPALTWVGQKLQELGSVYLKSVLEAWNALADGIYEGLKLIVQAYNWIAERMGWTTIDLAKLEAQVDNATSSTEKHIKMMAENTKAPLGEMQQSIAAVGQTAAATSSIMSAFLHHPRPYLGTRGGREWGGYSPQTAYNLGLISREEEVRRLKEGRFAPIDLLKEAGITLHAQVSVEGVPIAQGIASNAGKGDYVLTG
ncbi:MAG: hypothetical protein ACXQT3_06115 [Methermicoccaceae archaeon]